MYANEAIFNMKFQNPANVGLNTLEDAQLIIAEDFDTFNQNTIDLLKIQLEKGKTILLIPSSMPETGNLARVSASLGLPIIQVNTQNTSENSSVDDLKIPDLKNPFFANIFESSEKNMDVPFAKPILNWGNKGQTILETKKDQAFIVQFSKPKGKVFICSTPLLDKFTNFQKHSFFVPIMYKIATMSTDANKNLDFSFNDKNVSVYASKLNAKNKVSMKKGDFSYIPEQTIRGSQLIFNLPQEIAQAGFYDLQLGDSLLSTIAINIPKEESRLENYSISELKTLFESRKNVILYENAINEAFVNDFKTAHIGTGLWKYCLIIALIFLMLETLLIRFLKS